MSVLKNTFLPAIAGHLLCGVSLFVPVAAGWTPLPRWACVFNILKRFRMLFFISGANASGSIMTNSPCII